MKQREVLEAVFERIATVTPYAPNSLNLAPLESGGYTFQAAVRNLSEEFRFFGPYVEDLEESERAPFEGLFAWLREQIQSFPDNAINPEQSSAKILALAALFELDRCLWDQLAKVVTPMPDSFVATLRKQINEFKVDANDALTGTGVDPEKQIEVLADIASRNWGDLDWAFDYLQNQVWSDAKNHILMALYSFDRSSVQSIVEEENDFFEIASHIFHIPAQQCLQLAIASTNWTFKFWTIYWTVRGAVGGRPRYLMEWETLLSQAARFPDEWARWLAVLNKYPSRYPQLQEALGRVLTSASDHALEAYVSSISIGPDLGREEIATALQIFREKAPLRERQRLWTAAFVRWKAWDFERTEHSSLVLQVTRSCLDYPVMGYLVECMSSDDRTKYMAQLEKCASAVETDWHTDRHPPMSERFRLISRYQLVAHAEAVAAGEAQWLCPSELYRPAWEDGTHYRSLKYDDILKGPTFLDS